MPLATWPPELWERALRATHSPSWVICRSKDECDAVCAAERGWRAFAFDLGQRPGAANHPKGYIAAPLGVFVRAYSMISPAHRHAYEIIEGLCSPFFDLECYGEQREDGDANAKEVEQAARATVTELAAAQQLAVSIETVALDSANPNKFSRHLILRVTEVGSGRAVLLREPREAGALAARVAERVGRCEQLIDGAVYAAGRCFRLLGSSKLAGTNCAPLELNMERSRGTAPPAQLGFTAQVIGSLVVPAVVEGAVLLAPMPPVSARPRPPSSAAPTAAAAPATSTGGGPALTQAAWECRWRHLTTMPLLDTPGLAHPRVTRRLRGKGLPTAPFDGLGRWGAAELAKRGAALASWRYEEAEWPPERLLHIIGCGGCCAHIGRPHTSENIMITLDLLNAIAWQRCFDKSCRVNVGRGYRKARTFVGSVPSDLLPCM